MADGTVLNSMAGGDTVDTEDIGARGKLQRIKLVIGAIDADGGDVSSSNGLPVTLLASTAAIGKLAANAGVNIGTVDIATVPSNMSMNLAQVGASSVALAGDVNNASAITATQDVAPVARYNATLPTITDTRYNMLQIGSRGGLHVNIMSKDGTVGATVTAGNALQIDVTSIGGTTVVNGGTAGILAVAGSTATNVALTDNPLNMGAQAVSSENSAVTTARKVQLVADLVGKLIVLPFANPENTLNGVIDSAITDTTSTALIAAQAAGVRIYVTDLAVSNSHATVGTFVKILDGTNIIWEEYAAAAGGGFSRTFGKPLRGSTATALNVQPVTTGANIKASANGYKGV